MFYYTDPPSFSISLFFVVLSCPCELWSLFLVNCHIFVCVHESYTFWSHVRKLFVVVFLGTHDSMNSDYAVNDSLFLIYLLWSFMHLWYYLCDITIYYYPYYILYQYINNFSCKMYTLYMYLEWSTFYKHCFLVDPSFPSVVIPFVNPTKYALFSFIIQFIVYTFWYTSWFTLYYFLQIVKQILCKCILCKMFYTLVGWK